MAEQKKSLMILEITGIILVLSLVLAFTGTNLKHTGGFYFQAKSYGGAIQGIGEEHARSFAGQAIHQDIGYECTDLTNILTRTKIKLQEELQIYPYNEQLKEQYEKAISLEKTYKDFTKGLRSYENRLKQECIEFPNLAKITGLQNAIPKNNIAFCCKR